jgi:4-amino-4-deoxy-L-arabinose transferase-like glycosyltransferase
MSKSWQLSATWLTLICSILVVTNLPGRSWLYQVMFPYNYNRWLHFIAYATIAAIPVVAWRRWSIVLASVVAALLVVALGSLQTFLPNHMDRPQPALPDLFGIAAGILLGLNLRMMRA